MKTIAEHCSEVTSHLTIGTLTHDLHEVKCFWDTGWLEIPLRYKNVFAKAILARITIPMVSPLLPWQARRSDPRKHFLVLLDPCIIPHFYLPELAGPVVQQQSGPWLALRSGWCRWQPASALAGPAPSAPAAGS